MNHCFYSSCGCEDDVSKCEQVKPETAPILQVFVFSLPGNRMHLTGRDGFLGVYKVLGTVVLLLGPWGQQWNCQGSLQFHPCFSSKCLSSSWWLSMSENRWKERQVTIEIFWVLFFSSELDGDVASVKATYEKAKAKNVELHEIALKSLATFLKKVGEPVPFTEPPVSIS